MIALIYVFFFFNDTATTETLSWYIYSTGFLDQDLGSAAAQAIVMIIAVTIVAQLFVRRLRYRKQHDRTRRDQRT